MILIVSSPRDAHTRYVLHRLGEKGVEAVCLDAAELPTQAQLATWIDRDGSMRTRLRRAGGDIDLSAVRTIWLRRLSAAKPDPNLSAEDQTFVKRETTAFLQSMALLLGDRFWVNPYVPAFANDRGHGKLAQLQLACSVGLNIPATLATNDPEAAREFVKEHDDGVIYKPFQAPTVNLAEPGEPNRYGTVYTTKMDDDALSNLDGVRQAPCIFQQLVPKRIELRVTVIGHKVFATEIHSQVHEESAIDFRRHYALDETPYEAHTLPEPIARATLELHRQLGLRFGASDFVLTPDGRYVFLEVNQQGQFLWLEMMTNQPLLENFCEMLIQGTPDYTCDVDESGPALPELPALEDD